LGVTPLSLSGATKRRANRTSQGGEYSVIGAILSGDRFAATREDGPKIAYRREHFIVPVRALRVVRALLVFHDVLVLAKNIFGKPGHER
jgi:hypothetical protein